MRTYESLYIVRPDLSEDEVPAIAKQVEALVTENGGTIVQSETWGKRKLAYEVKQCTEGTYILLRFESDETFVERLESFYRLNDNVIRFLTVLFEKQTLRLEEEQRVRNEENIRANAGDGYRGGDRGGDRRGDSDAPAPRRVEAAATPAPAATATATAKADG